MAYTLGTLMDPDLCLRLVAGTDSAVTLAASFLVGLILYPLWFFWIGALLRRVEPSPRQRT